MSADRLFWLATISFLVAGVIAMLTLLVNFWRAVIILLVEPEHAVSIRSFCLITFLCLLGIGLAWAGLMLTFWLAA